MQPILRRLLATLNELGLKDGKSFLITNPKDIPAKSTRIYIVSKDTYRPLFIIKAPNSLSHPSLEKFRAELGDLTLYHFTALCYCLLSKIVKITVWGECNISLERILVHDKDSLCFETLSGPGSLILPSLKISDIFEIMRTMHKFHDCLISFRHFELHTGKPARIQKNSRVVRVED